MSEEPIIELKNVSKYFGTFQALKGVNLQVMHGERVVMCGPSGSGKSTMIAVSTAWRNTMTASSG